MDLSITCDGSCNWHRTHAGIVVRNAKDGSLLAEVSWPLKGRTNNEAEYGALIEGCARAWRTLDEHDAELGNITFYVDSQLLVRQLNGAYAVREKGLRKLHQEAVTKLKELKARVVWHRREAGDGPRADELSKERAWNSRSNGTKKTWNGNFEKSWKRAASESSSSSPARVPNPCLPSSGVTSP